MALMYHLVLRLAVQLDTFRYSGERSLNMTTKVLPSGLRSNYTVDNYGFCIHALFVLIELNAILYLFLEVEDSFS